MRRSQHQRTENLQARRHRVAAAAARLIAGLGVADYRDAKRRAARELGYADEASLPDDALVLEQVLEYQRLFRGPAQAQVLDGLRRAALDAMQFLAAFEPRLVGRVLDGSADEGSPVELQVFSEDPDGFARFLLDIDLPSRSLGERRLAQVPGQPHSFPAWGLQADGIGFEVVVLPMAWLRQPPLGADGRPMARAGRAAVQRLLQDAAP